MTSYNREEVATGILFTLFSSQISSFSRTWKSTLLAPFVSGTQFYNHEFTSTVLRLTDLFILQCFVRIIFTDWLEGCSFKMVNFDIHVCTVHPSCLICLHSLAASDSWSTGNTLQDVCSHAQVWCPRIQPFTNFSFAYYFDGLLVLEYEHPIHASIDLTVCVCVCVLTFWNHIILLHTSLIYWTLKCLHNKSSEGLNIVSYSLLCLFSMPWLTRIFLPKVPFPVESTLLSAD